MESCAVFLDLTAGPDVARSRSQIRFRCRTPGASTVADLAAARLDSAFLNGTELDPAAAWDGEQLRLAGLAASNVLIVEAQMPVTHSGRGLTRFTEPAGDDGEPGGEYVLTQPYELILLTGPYVTVARAQSPSPAQVDLTVRCRPCLAGAPGPGRVAELVGNALAYYAALLGCKIDTVQGAQQGLA